MNIKMLCGAVLLAGGLAVCAGAQAQPRTGPGSPSCQIIPEAIVDVRPPFFGTPSVWDATFGDRVSLVQFAGALPLENGNVLASGDVLDKAFRPVEQVMVELNRRARAVEDKRNPAKSGENSSAMLATGVGYVVSATIFGGARNAEKRVKLSWYDNARNFRSQTVLQDPAYDYESMGLTPAAKGDGVVAIVHAVHRKHPDDEYAMLFRIGAQGKLLWKRAYRPGIPNQIYGVGVTGDRHYIAGGRIRNEDGRMAGWVLKLNDDGTIVWQNTYPRGNAAMLRGGYAKPAGAVGDHYVMAGQVMPVGGGPGAAWVMEVDALGKPVWQRYFRSNGYDFDGRAVQAYPDGRISIMVNARAADTSEGQQSHIRLLTLSPRGGLMEDESYLEGHSAYGTQMVVGSQSPWRGERIVTAFVERVGNPMEGQKKVELITEALTRQEREQKMAAQENLQGPPAPTPEQAAVIAQSIPDEIYHQGWVFVATALDPYSDPCVMAESPMAE